ncbi:phosphoglycerate mutase-like protein [Biscogniauxia mediterranea]|nr:phosphoglycerate mutase-like protein [Biscogniauxia mediterranea]
MYLLLIRHGESVDNVAGLYAGSRDSPLTNHGVLQALRLGEHLAKQRSSIGPIRHIFSSNLKRAVRTAEAVADAQRLSHVGEVGAQQDALQVVQLPELREKDFGSAEGTKYGTRDRAGKDDAESHASMSTRINQFLRAHLDPVVDRYASEEVTVAIVSHGIILDVLFHKLTKRHQVEYPPSYTLAAGKGTQPRQTVAWSNTGVLQIKIEPKEGTVSSQQPAESTATASSVGGGSTAPADSPSPAVQLTVRCTNNLDHLRGLKKTRGGIGSAKFDSRQRTMESFFSPAAKKRKREEPDER